MPPEDPGSAREDERDRRQLGERARHMASQVRERLPNVRGYVPSRDELRRRTHELRHTTEDHPALWIMGAFAAGSFFASIMPVTEQERRLLGQARVRAQSGIEGLKQQAWGQFTGLKQTATNAAMEMVREIARGNRRGPSYPEGPAGGPQQPQGGSNWQPDGEPSSSRIRKHGPGGAPVGGSYHAGGTNEEERRESGWSPAPDPNDVTRH